VEEEKIYYLGGWKKKIRTEVKKKIDEGAVFWEEKMI
jgi:hypothetical protein